MLRRTTIPAITAIFAWMAFAIATITNNITIEAHTSFRARRTRLTSSWGTTWRATEWGLSRWSPRRLAEIAFMAATRPIGRSLSTFRRTPSILISIRRNLAHVVMLKKCLHMRDQFINGIDVEGWGTGWRSRNSLACLLTVYGVEVNCFF